MVVFSALAKKNCFFENYLNHTIYGLQMLMKAGSREERFAICRKLYLVDDRTN